MEFANNQLSHTDLPEFSKVSFSPLHELFVRLRLGVLAVVYALVVFSIVAALVVTIQIEPQTIDSLMRPAVFVAALVILLLMGLVAWFVFASTKAIHYAIREHDIVLKSGVFWKKEVIQPLKRVQHVEVTQGPLDKRFDLANLKLFSAGTSKSTFRIPGIEHELAEKLRQFVLDHQKAPSKAMNQRSEAPQTPERRPVG